MAIPNTTQLYLESCEQNHILYKRIAILQNDLDIAEARIAELTRLRTEDAHALLRACKAIAKLKKELLERKLQNE